jgi:hypothetical protein
VTAGSGSRVPLADLIAVGFGRAGRDATAVLAVALTMGTGNVYTAGSAKLVASLAHAGGLPRWLGGDADRSVPRRPLAALAVTSAILLCALVAGVISAAALIRATSACFILVYVLALGVGSPDLEPEGPRSGGRRARPDLRRRGLLVLVPRRPGRRRAALDRLSPCPREAWRTPGRSAA